MLPLDSTITNLDKAKRNTQNGGEYWMAREIQAILGYDKWDNFDKVIKKGDDGM